MVDNYQDRRKGSQSFAESFVEKNHLRVSKDAQLPPPEVLKKAFGREAVPEHLTENDLEELAETAYILFLERQEVKRDLQKMENQTVSESIREAEQLIENEKLPLVTDPREAEQFGVHLSPGSTELSTDQRKVATTRKFIRTRLQERAAQRKVSSESVPTTRLEDKLALIQKGSAGALLQEARMEAPADARRPQAEERLRRTEEQLLAIFQIPGVLEAYQAGFDRERKGMNKAREVIQLRQLFKELLAQEDRIQRTAWAEGRSISVLEQQDFEENAVLRRAIQERVNELLEDEDAIDALRVMELQDYKTQLHTDGFAETPSRERLIVEIREQVAKGSKVLLLGESGTGKTELWFHASRSLFGTKGHSVTGGPDLSVYAIYGTKGMTRDGDVTRQGPFTKSLIDRGGKGSPFLFDEINNAPPELVMGMKTALNAGPGDEIEIPLDTEHEYVAGQDWAFGAAMNPKSVRYRTRQELDPAVKRLLSPIPVDYIPPDELYDIFLATLMDNRGGAPLAKQDALETLYHFTEGIGWVQTAFAGKKVIVDGNGTALFDRNGAARGELATLKKTIIDPGRARSMLLGYEKSRARGDSLMTHLNNELFKFVQDVDLPEDDRYYVIEIFTLKGFFGTPDWTAQRFGISTLDEHTFEQWKQGNRAARLSKKITPQEAYLSRQELAKIDPYHKKKGGVGEDLDALIGDDLAGFAAPEVGPTYAEKLAQDLADIAQATDAIALTKVLDGGIRSNTRPPQVHEAYVKRIDQLARSGDMPVEDALHLLDEYNKNGVYGPGTTIDVKDVAASLSRDLLNYRLTQETDFVALENLIGGIDQKHTSSDTHKAYLNRIERIANGSSTPSQIDEALAALDRYAQNGAYSSSMNNLRDEAKSKADSLRKRVISKENDVNRMIQVLGQIDSKLAGSDIHKSYLDRLESLGKAEPGALFKVLQALDDYGNNGAYSSSYNNLRTEASSKAAGLRQRAIQQETDLDRLVQIVGGIDSRVGNSEVHTAYLNRLVSLGRTASGQTLINILNALDNYGRYGTYNSSYNNLRLDAGTKANELRTRAIQLESDVDRLLQLLGSIDTITASSDVHRIYINKLDALGKSASQGSATLNAVIAALENYSSYGAYKSAYNDLRSEARTKAQELKRRFGIP